MGLVRDIRREFEKQFPFCLLSNVILYRNDRGDLDLYANEIDFLFHHIKDNQHQLVIVEAKDREISGNSAYEEPDRHSQWTLKYYNDPSSPKMGSKVKDIKKQVQDQATALGQFCANLSTTLPTIECWIVDKRNGSKNIIIDEKDNRLKLLTMAGFRQSVNNIKSIVPIIQSDYLRELRLGTPSPHMGHPEIPNAIRFIENCRKCLDDQIFRFFNPIVHYSAINGCAGMGKSVLLAYCIYVFASDYSLDVNNFSYSLKPFRKKADKINLPDIPKRGIFVYAVKQKQVDALQAYWEKIKSQIALLCPGFQPGISTPQFGRWQGRIPKKCNILVIDEAHDLSHEDQLIISKWISPDNNHQQKYLLVACDRNQALKRRDSDTDIISGTNFTGHSTRLNRIYRCPFPVYVASIGILFRWFAPQGIGVYLSNESLREHFGFQPKVEKREGKVILTMRNDCHPGNNWRQTVGNLRTCEVALSHLSQSSIKREDVLWATYSKENPEFDYSEIQKKYTHVDLTGPNSDNEVDLYIKGQEFAIVIVEGIPDGINPTGLMKQANFGTNPTPAELAMWKRRRNLYIVCSRASAFLYFIVDFDGISNPDTIEFKNIIKQVSSPSRKKNESGQIWQFEVAVPKITRKPYVFKDIEKHVFDEEPPNHIMIEAILSVETLAKSFHKTKKQIQELLPHDAKAKLNEGIVVLPKHLPYLAKGLGYKLVSIQSNKYVFEKAKNKTIPPVTIIRKSVSRSLQKKTSPSADDWRIEIPELSKMRPVKTWKAICDYLGIHVGPNSARRALKEWVEDNKPKWPRVPEPK